MCNKWRFCFYWLQCSILPVLNQRYNLSWISVLRFTFMYFIISKLYVILWYLGTNTRLAVIAISSACFLYSQFVNLLTLLPLRYTILLLLLTTWETYPGAKTNILWNNDGLMESNMQSFECGAFWNSMNDCTFVIWPFEEIEVSVMVWFGLAGFFFSFFLSLLWKFSKMFHFCVLGQAFITVEIIWFFTNIGWCTFKWRS